MAQAVTTEAGLQKREQGALPEGWVWATLDEVAENRRNAIVDGPFGSNLKVSDYIEDPSAVPVLTTKNLEGDFSNKSLRFISRAKFEELKRSEVRAGDILVAKIGSCGKTGIYPSHMPSAIIPANLLKMTIHTLMVKMYVFHYLNSPSFKRQLEQIITATAQPAFNVSKFRKLPIPLAPLAEQHRIVAKIDELFTQLDAGVAGLKRVQIALKRYRASVLKAACEGKLVSQDPSDEPASVLLGRILAARRAKWEADLMAKGKDPAKVKYEEPAAPDAEGLPELPEGWVWVSLGQCSYRITDGTHQPPTFVESGIPFIFVKHMVGGSILFDGTKYISEATYKQLNSRCPVEVGDILYSAVGSYGVAVPVTIDRQFSFQRHIAHIKPSRQLSVHYLTFCLNSEVGLAQAHRTARGVAQKTVTLGDLTRFVVPIAPINEQQRIVAEVERRLSVLQELEATVVANLKRAERLRQAILKRAFEGKLVSQDPLDEPAKVPRETTGHQQRNDSMRKESASVAAELEASHKQAEFGWAE